MSAAASITVMKCTLREREGGGIGSVCERERERERERVSWLDTDDSCRRVLTRPTRGMMPHAGPSKQGLRARRRDKGRPLCARDCPHGRPGRNDLEARAPPGCCLGG